MNGNNDAATARDWHGAFTPAHGISQNRPKQSGLSIDIFIYNRVDDLRCPEPKTKVQKAHNNDNDPMTQITDQILHVFICVLGQD